MKLCYKCSHCRVYLAQPNYSDMTPGSSFEMECTRNHWKLDAYVDDAPVLYRYITMAETCVDYAEAEWVNR